MEHSADQVHFETTHTLLDMMTPQLLTAGWSGAVALDLKDLTSLAGSGQKAITIQHGGTVAAGTSITLANAPTNVAIKLVLQNASNVPSFPAAWKVMGSALPTTSSNSKVLMYQIFVLDSLTLISAIAEV